MSSAIGHFGNIAALALLMIWAGIHFPRRKLLNWIVPGIKLSIVSRKQRGKHGAKAKQAINISN